MSRSAIFQGTALVLETALDVYDLGFYDEDGIRQTLKKGLTFNEVNEALAAEGVLAAGYISRATWPPSQGWLTWPPPQWAPIGQSWRSCGVEPCSFAAYRDGEQHFVGGAQFTVRRPFDWARDCPADDLSRRFPPVVGRGRGYIMFGPSRIAPWTRSEIVRWIVDRPLRSKTLHELRDQSYRRGPHPSEERNNR